MCSCSHQSLRFHAMGCDEKIGVINTFYENGSFSFYMLDRVKNVILHTNPPRLRHYVENLDCQVIEIKDRPPKCMVELERFVSKYLNENYWIRKTSIPIDLKEAIL